MHPVLGFFEPQGFEWLVLLIIALLIFGHKLPSVARSLGSSVSEFKKGVRDGENELARTEPAKPQAEATAAPVSEKK